MIKIVADQQSRLISQNKRHSNSNSSSYQTQVPTILYKYEDVV